MIIFPVRLVRKLEEDTSGKYLGALTLAANKFGEILTENDLYFFKEYTDHGVKHINSVLSAADNIITEDSFKILTPEDAFILISSIFLHDLGMHIKPLMFDALLDGKYDSVRNEYFDSLTWKDLWFAYMDEAKRFSTRKMNEIFGEENFDVTEPDFKNEGSITGSQKKLVGEFIRRHHCRLANEIGLKGIVDNNGQYITFFDAVIDKQIINLAGLVARSHGLDIRLTYALLKVDFGSGWKRPFNSQIFFLMIVLRIADYFQIDTSRVLLIPYRTKSFKSPVSVAEHKKHFQTKYVQPMEDDPETLFVFAQPESSVFYVSLQKLFFDIQDELDKSWAILGEIYGNKKVEQQPKIAYRRIYSNILDKANFEKTVEYIPESIQFTVDYEIPKLLISPLYGEDPSYGVRELLQNSIDACLERTKLINRKVTPKIEIDLSSKGQEYYFTIKDNGKGMSFSEVKNYFLKIGGSFRKSVDWYKAFAKDGKNANVRRSGRFGIGVLAAYLLGQEIEVESRSWSELTGIRFKTTLEQDQIEIKKNVIAEIGTKIRIKIPVSIYEKLTKDVDSDEYNHHSLLNFGIDKIDYVSWYVLDKPKVIYKVNGKIFKVEEVTYYSFSEEENWRDVKVKEFNEVKWRYCDTSNYRNKIICNGIIIPARYKFGGEIIKNAPVISVFDNNAKLPLSLNRNFLTSRLPFEDEIAEDIYRDILAKLLTTHIKTKKRGNLVEINPTESFAHYAISRAKGKNNIGSYFFNSEGFILNIRDIAERYFSNLNIIVVSNYYNGDEPLQGNAIPLKIPRKTVLRFDYYDKGDSWKIQNIFSDLSYGGAGYIHSDIFKPFHILDHGVDSAIIKLDDNWYGTKSTEEELTDIYRQILTRPSLIEIYKPIRKREEWYRIMQNGPSKGFIEQFYYLFGDDPFIPFAIKDRKNKFPKAYKELRTYIDKNK